MDKKTKKRIDVLRQRIQKLQNILANLKQQRDDPRELVEAELELKKAREELGHLTGAAT